MHLVDVKRFIKIQVLKLKNEGLTSKEISRYLNLTNPDKFRIFNEVCYLYKIFFRLKCQYCFSYYFIKNVRVIAHRNEIRYLKGIHNRFSWYSRIKVTDAIIQYIHVKSKFFKSY